MTEFMLSIHRASMGPSNIIHCSYDGIQERKQTRCHGRGGGVDGTVAIGEMKRIFAHATTT